LLEELHPSSRAPVLERSDVVNDLEKSPALRTPINGLGNVPGAFVTGDALEATGVLHGPDYSPKDPFRRGRSPVTFARRAWGFSRRISRPGASRGTVRRVTGPWVVVLEKPSGAPLRRVGGLSIALRLALDAQRAGASAVVCTGSSGVLPGALRDARLRIPILEHVPKGNRAVRVPASLLVHRDAFATAVERAHGDDNADVALTVDNGGVETPYGFAPIEITDATVARRAEGALFRSLRKPQDGWTSR
jgi:hypothetical protein